MNKENVGISIYYDNRMLRILLLGAISGFPWVIIGSALSLWLKDYELSRSTIGWAGLIFSVYAINFLWAPLIDRLKIPILTDKIGHRKSWIITLQSIILLCLIRFGQRFFILIDFGSIFLSFLIGLGESFCHF